MLTREENELLTRVEGDAPMGQMMRRHWTPACLSEELPEPGCAPRRLRLFGENLTDRNYRVLGSGVDAAGRNLQVVLSLKF